MATQIQVTPKMIWEVWELDDSDEQIIHLLGGGQISLSRLEAMESAYRVTPPSSTCTSWRQSVTGG